MSLCKTTWLYIPVNIDIILFGQRLYKFIRLIIKLFEQSLLLFVFLIMIN